MTQNPNTDPGPIHHKFIASIAKAAIAAGTTPQGAVVMAGRTEATWYNWKAGNSSPTARDMQAILDAIEDYKLVKAQTAR